MKWIVIVFLILIVLSLASAAIFLTRDKSGTRRMANALTVRIALSVILFGTILFANWMGWIQSTGLPITNPQ